MAHEIKNPLTPIRLAVESLRKARTRDPALFEEMFDEEAAIVLEEVERLRRPGPGLVASRACTRSHRSSPSAGRG